MAGEDLQRILDGMDQQMLDGYNEYALECVEPWASFSGNQGQMTIVKKYIIPVAQEHATAARPDWPESATPGDYLEAIYGSYDSDVIASAFSDTIEQIYAELNGYWQEASYIQEEHALLLRGGENQGPHSTHAVWRG